MARKSTQDIEYVDGTEVVEKPTTRTIVQMVDPAINKRQQDNERLNELNRQFRTKIAKDPKVTYSPPKYYADILGKIYMFTLNGVEVVVRFDGTPQKFPKTIYEFIVKKLGRVLDGQTHVQKIDEL